jgi:hypothetical protein
MATAGDCEMVQEVDAREELLRSLSDICETTRSFTEQDKIFCFSVPGDKAEEVWQHLRMQSAKSGHWPVILGSEDDCEEQIYAVQHPEELGFEPREALIAKGLQIDAKTWLANRLAANPDFYETDENNNDNDLSPINAINKKYEFYSLQALEQAYHPEVHLALLPTTNSWEAPAYLYYGGWNECPNPEEHVAMFKHWHEKYGAEVFALAGDVVELYVARPVTTPKAADELVKEQFVYCTDIVHQGTNTLHGLAKEVLQSSGWFFWWD